MRYFDTHCHLNSPELREDVAEELERCRSRGVVRMAIVGSTMADSREALQICEAHHEYGLFPVVGIHPHEVKDVADGVPDELLSMAQKPEVRAWGEIGLDYHYDLSPRDVQRRLLAEQLDAANTLHKPVVFHVREAYDDFWPIVNSGRAPEKAVLHCFSGEADDLRHALNLGWKIGVTGVITFAKAEEFRAMVGRVPLEALLCETDSPWMAPKPFRGQTNRPSLVPLVYVKLAEVKSMPVEEVAEQIWRNACEFYGLNELEE